MFIDIFITNYGIKLNARKQTICHIINAPTDDTAIEFENKDAGFYAIFHAKPEVSFEITY